MKIAPVAEVKARLSSFLEETVHGPVIITRNGHAIAALVAVSDDDDIERLLLAHSPRLRQLLEQAATRVAEEGGLTHEQFWAQVDADAALAEDISSKTLPE
ncbi:MAG: type II toxin-antitoxin system Phd/YefM family antitoxin [Chloroflexi bacterium]|nr:type II toxin-antitoxin system Phd/YefM family antitoxin [Chloroflexota bacterium]